MGKNLDYRKATRREAMGRVLRHPDQKKDDAPGSKWLEQQAKHVLEIDKLLSKMAAKGLVEAKAKCPKCDTKGALYLFRGGPRFIRIYCTNAECDFVVTA